MLKKPVFFLLITLLLFSVKVRSQQSRSDYELNVKMKKALSLMEAKDYNNANTVFRNILATEKVLPNNLSYHFALTLFHVSQYRNSKNFLDKYLKLTGKGGDFYEQAIQLEGLLENEFNAIIDCNYCDNNGYKLLMCTTCNGNKNSIEKCTNCQAIGIMKCKKCKGEGVVITIDDFGAQKYQTCDRCNGKGIHTCELCNGSKHLNLACNHCLGTGLESSKVICTHSNN